MKRLLAALAASAMLATACGTTVQTTGVGASGQDGTASAPGQVGTGLEAGLADPAAPGAGPAVGDTTVADGSFSSPRSPRQSGAT